MSQPQSLNKFSMRVQQVIQYSREEAIRLGHDFIGTEHLLLGIIRLGDGEAIKILQDMGCDLNNLRESIEKIAPKTSRTMNINNIPFTKRAEDVLKSSYLEGKRSFSDIIGTEHLLLALLKQEDSMVAFVLRNLNVTYKDVESRLICPYSRSDILLKLLSDFDSLLVEFPFSKRSWNILKTAHAMSLQEPSNVIRTEHLLLSLLKEKDSAAEKILSRLEITEAKIRAQLEAIR